MRIDLPAVAMHNDARVALLVLFIWVYPWNIISPHVDSPDMSVDKRGVEHPVLAVPSANRARYALAANKGGAGARKRSGLPREATVIFHIRERRGRAYDI